MKHSSERDSNPDLCDAGPVLHQLNYQANWELVIMWVNDKHLAIEYMRSNQPVNKISFELWKETTFNVNDLRSFATLLKDGAY